MIKFLVENLNKKIFELEYPQVLFPECKFSIYVDSICWFCEPNFPIYEFFKFLKEWENNNLQTDMHYISMETNENPLISFEKIQCKWKISSQWQNFQCDRLITGDELKLSFQDLKKQLS